MSTTEPSDPRIGSHTSHSRRRKHRRRKGPGEDEHHRRKSQAVDEDHKHEKAKSAAGKGSRNAEESPDSGSESSGDAGRRHQRTRSSAHGKRNQNGATSKSKAGHRPRTASMSASSDPRRSSSAVPKPKPSAKQNRASSADSHPAPKKTAETFENVSVKRAPSAYRKRGPASVLLSALFGPSRNLPRKPPPNPPRNPPRKPPRSPSPETMVTCLVCLSDDIPASKSAKLACSHHMCNACLKRLFTLSISDPQHMPPKCCTSDHIPLKHVEKLFDTKFKMTWNKKYQEFTTKNRIYCPAPGCGEWIKPSSIHLDTSSGPTGGRKYAKCSKCKLKICVLCNGKWHRKKDCPNDENTKKFVEIAKEAGWQRCYNCSAMVELKEGCNHMKCRCNAEFCIICGAKWKSCDCPWFNYNHMPEMHAFGDMHHHHHHHHNNPLHNHPAFRRMMNARAGQGREDHQAPLRYQQEMDRRREQERNDEALARRLQAMYGFEEQNFGFDGDNDNANNNDNDNGDGDDDGDSNGFPPIFENYRTRRSHPPFPRRNANYQHITPFMPPPRAPVYPDGALNFAQLEENARRLRRRGDPFDFDMATGAARVEQWRVGLNFGR
ncbi:hypothetical protein PRK78_004923 [Emydomyces testavorans]|uniref:RBR-type E3 ubiquitin transferase n=1 Tax=Emydomyces testavorans TaxID=2070801 RepID=A0AAF0DJI4_9EURO|nr:hypothetical protein PRK78_004923 [Emydomyces testavorans]